MQVQVLLPAPWIDKSIINDFIGFIINGSNHSSVHRVNYEPITGNWTIDGKHYFNGNTNLEVTYGLKRYNALWIIEATVSNLMKRLAVLFNYREEGKLFKFV